MNGWLVQFPVSGVHTWILLPPLVAFVVSSVTSMAGVSGAFILLPFQMSVLGFTSPSVTSTNFVYNIVAIPSGVYRYLREGRMVWPLTWVVIAGTLPGVFLGYYLRTRCLPDPRAFKLFVGLVLLALGLRLLAELAGARRRRDDGGAVSLRAATAFPAGDAVRTIAFTLRAGEYEFRNERFRFNVPALFSLALGVGVIGGAYGIGGGAFIAPLCVTLFRLPVYTVAGAALFSTFLTSIAGVVLYTVLPAAGGLATAPDWPLGILFGMGGFAGMYLGARLQRYVPQRAIKFLLGIMLVALALRYVTQFFR